MSFQSPEIYWLTLTVLFTSVMWGPYIVMLILDHGPVAAFMDGNGDLHPKTNWARRAKQAHYNAVENLVVFAPLVLAVVVMDKADSLTAKITMAYFCIRVAHYAVYVLGIPVLRTAIFLVGFACQILLGVRLFGLV